MAGPLKRYVFGEKAAKRIAETVRRVESTPRFGAGPPSGPLNWNPGVLDAVVTTAITAGTSSAYGSGQAQIKTNDGSDGKIDDPAYPDPVYVKNGYLNSGTIAVGTFIRISWRGGYFNLLGADC